MTDIFSIPTIVNDPSLHATAKRYRAYNTIRRDLRSAYRILTDLIEVSSGLVEKRRNFEDVVPVLHLYQAALLHAVILYARWFAGTNGKPALHVKQYFQAGSEHHRVHLELMELRNRFIAHRELDLMGGDQVWARYGADGKFQKVESTWSEMQLPNPGKLSSFRGVIELVHNQINSVKIPELTQRLERALRSGV